MANVKWKTEKELKREVNRFFKISEEEEKPVTRCALAVFLGITKSELMSFTGGERDTESEKFSAVLKMADTKIEEYAEKLLFTKDKGHTALMFYLKSNFGWSEKGVEEEKNEDISVNISVI